MSIKSGLLCFNGADAEQHREHQNRRDGERHIDVLDKARDDEADERNTCDGHSVGELGRDVV